MRKNRTSVSDFWLDNLPESHADYLSYTEIELGRHPSAFLIYQDHERFIKQVPKHIYQVEHSILSWLNTLELNANNRGKLQAPTELKLPKLDELSTRLDLLITSKLEGGPLTKKELIQRSSLVCKVLVYIHRLVEVAQLPNIIMHSLDHELPIQHKDVDACYLAQFNQARNNIYEHKSILGFVHGDLSIGNILANEKSIGIVDWEYASVRDCRWDLATLAVEFGLNDSEFESLCASYLKERGLKLEGLEENSFINVAKSWVVIYAITCLSWSIKHNQNTNRYVQFLTNVA